MKLADAIVWALRTWDTGYVFGVSGANIEPLHDAIVRSGGSVRSVLAKSEVGAAFMADARARAHRTLGVCCATSGGGMMNLAVGIAESFSDRVPVLAIVGQVPSHLEGRGGFQDSSGRGRTLRADKLFDAIAKFSAKVERPEEIWTQLERSASEALSGVQGPAVLLVPRDAFEVEVGEAPDTFPGSLDELATDSAVDAASLGVVMDALRRAHRPVFVVGRGLERAPTRRALVELANMAGIPVATTMAHPAAYPNDDPMYLGCVGAAGHPSAHRYLNERTDLIVTLGANLSVMVREPWERGLKGARVIIVDEEPAHAHCDAPCAFSVRAAPADVLRELTGLYRMNPFTRAYEGCALRRYVPELAPSARPPGAVDDALLQSQAIAMLEEHLPPAGHVLFDAGNCGAASIHGMRLPRDCRGIVALGMGGMGYSIAGAIGVQLGETSGRTVVLAGDGAFLMLGTEIHTAVELGLPILFVVFNNGKHGMCVTRQQRLFEGRVDCAEYTPVDVAAICRGLGSEDRLRVARASTRAELAGALEDYQRDLSRPFVLELVLACEEIPPFASLLTENTPTYEVSKGATRALHRAA